MKLVPASGATRLRSALLLALAASFTGCGVIPVSTVVAPAGQVVLGSVHGGQQPISGAQIQLYAVGTTADGSASTPLLAAPVPTLADGSFNFSLSSPCTGANTLVYLAATGGNPGLAAGTNNPAIASLLAIGSCTALAQSTYLSIDEVTTVAAVNALAPYITGTTAIGASSAHTLALASAFTLATQFANNASGKSPGVNLPSGYTAPVASIYTLADAIAPCINSTGTDGNCATLFSYTTPPSPANAAPPTDTVAALLTIAQYPTQNISNIVGLAAPASPYQPIVTGTPGTLALALVPTTTTLGFSSLTFPRTASTFPAPQQDLVVTNTGSLTAVFSSTSFTISGTNAADFAQTNDCTTLAPGASCDVLLIATPSATGNRTATLTPSANLAQAQSVPLTVTGTPPSAGPVSVSPYSLNFTIANTYQDVTVTNQGTVPLTFQAPMSTGSTVSVSTSSCTGTLAAGATCTLTLRGGSDRSTFGYFILNDDAAAGSQYISIDENVSDNLYYTPNFTNTPLGSSSTITVFVSSNSNSMAASYHATITGPAAADYTPSSPGCQGSGAVYSSTYESCSFTITFTPSAPGARVARLGSSGYIPLTGFGGPTPPITGPAFTVPSSAGVSAVFNASNTASGSGSITLANTGTTTLTFPSINLFSKTPGLLSQTSNCASVASGSTCSIVISYNTPTSGTATGTLVVKDSTSGLSQSIVITGYTAYPSLTLNPSGLAFGSQNSGTTTTKTFTVSTNGQPVGRAITVGNYSGSTSQFSFPNGTTCAASTTAVCTFTLAYTPTASGAVSATFNVSDSTGNVSQTITATGTGVLPPQASLGITAYGFPSTTVGGQATTSTTLTNTGSSALSISSIAITGVVNANFTQGNTCPASLAAGANCTINIAFNPKVTGPQSATLQVVSNSASSPDTIALSGTGK